MRLRRSPDLQALYERAEWRCLDSTAMAYGARLLGLTVPHVATGADILAAILDRHLRRRRPADRRRPRSVGHGGAASRLPTVEVAQHRPPPRLLQDAPALARAAAFARAHPARFTLLAVGSPAQEQLAAAIQAGGATGIGLCIGAALDFWTGLTPRAPAWIRRLGCEWMFRLWREPRRLGRRYLLDDWAVLPLLLVARWRDGRRAAAR